MGTIDGEGKPLAALEEAVVRLQRELEQVRAELGALDTRHRSSLGGDRRCPACGCRKILHAREVLDRSEGGRSKLALQQPSIWREKGLGEFEVYVCTACGRCEWYVKDVDAVKVDGERFRLLEPEPGAGPFR